MYGRGLTILFLCMVFLTGCGSETVQETKPPVVRVQQAEAASASEDCVYAGVVRGRYETDLSFQVGGQILSRNAETGSRVRAGDVLMEINPRDVVQQTYAAGAQVESARAQLELARANLMRYQKLYEEEAIAAAVLDQYQTTYDAALAAYESASAQSAQAGHSLEYTRLTAPAAGVISSVQAEAGQVVAAGQKVMTLVQSGEMEVEIFVPENRLADVTAGAQVQVSFWSSSAGTTGFVREISPMADETTRTYRVRVSLPEPPAGIELGMTASAAVGGKNGALEGSVSLPLSAIYQTGDVPHVWVVEDDKVHLQEVKVTYQKENTALVRGVKPGTLVVTAGVHKLREGQEVRTGASS